MEKSRLRVPRQPVRHRRTRRPGAITVVGLLIAALLSVFTATAANADTTYTLWADTVTPGTTATSDTGSVELGVKFQSSTAGAIAGIRFYKGSGNDGTHTGTLWDASGNSLATVTFTGETTSGWQTALFTTPVNIAADTTYVASYHAPNGHYAFDSQGLANGVTSGPLEALSGNANGGNGVFGYGSGTTFPSGSYNNANYWVDVVFTGTYTPPPPPPATGLSIWSNDTVPANTSTSDSSAVELGTKFKSDVDGDVLGVRFYKGSGNTGTHVGNLWDASGNNLATVTFTGETASGWQQATFSAPVHITAATTYVVSYFAPSGHYAYDAAGLANAVDNGALHALSGTTGGGNGVYQYGSSSAFPASSYNNTNYWVDVVFQPPATTSSIFGTVGHPLVENGTDTSTVELGAKFTSDVDVQATGVRFYKATANTGTHTGSLWDASGNNLATVTFTGETASGWQEATFATPVNLTANTTYVVSYFAPGGHYSYTSGGLTYSHSNGPLHTLPGKNSSGLSVNGVYRAGSTGFPTSSFQAANYWVDVTVKIPSGTPEVQPTPRSGITGSGPVLVATDPVNHFTDYIGEMLKSEGIHEYASTDAGNIGASVSLTSYSTLVVGDTLLTSAQVSAITSWVNAGGNLIAFKPRANLYSLLGITAGAGKQTGGYIKVDTTQAPGAGIVGDTMQYHSDALEYTAASGTTAVATLYSDATTATTYAAVTKRTVGSGTAQSWAYDLGKSVVYTRQGNPDWQAQDRDASGVGPGGRSDDMFYGAAAWDNEPDWIDFNKIQIPQADEQQHLLVNMLQAATPLVRLNFLPNGAKAAVVMTGDGHPGAATQTRFDVYKNDTSQPAACNTPGSAAIADWQCYRYTAYDNVTGTAGGLTDAQAKSYQDIGFEYALHIDAGCTDINPFNADANVYTPQLSWFATNYPDILTPTTNRNHCISFSDYATVPKIEATHGIRLDTNYYYWPGGDQTGVNWVQNRPGLFTGTGLVQRFADTDGTLVDNYQATSQIVDEANLTYQTHYDTLLGNAVNNGWYTVLTANCHTDATGGASDSCAYTGLSSAKAHGVPVVSARQMLDWTTARENSTVTGMAYSGGNLTFTLGTPAHNLQVMIPITVGGKTLQSVANGSTAVTYTTDTIKGVSYALVNAAVAGTYTGTYA